jgi:hypothetical protein
MKDLDHVIKGGWRIYMIPREMLRYTFTVDILDIVDIIYGF